MSKLLVHLHARSKTLNVIMIRLIIPSREHPVSSDQMPNVPPKFAILAVVVVLTSNLVSSTSASLYFNLTIIAFLMKVFAISKKVELILVPDES